MNDKDLPNSIPATSMNLTEHNLEQLKELFPNVFTEGKVDFDALKAELGEHVERQDERYQFTWAGKEQAKRIATTPSLGTLRPAPEESVNWDETENLYIEGDNLEVLKLLQKSYFNKAKMIYIDPPYNTGKDFVYRDDFKDNLANYQRLTGQRDEEGNPLFTNSDTAGRYHSNWLNMMYPRLKLARNLLRDDGVIFISIDDNEVHNLRKICDEIFGENNLIAQICHKARASVSNDKIISSNHNHILWYARNQEKIFNSRRSVGLSPDLSGFSNPDNDPRGPWRSTPVDGPGGAVKGNPYYEFSGVTGYFRYSKETMEQKDKDGLIIKTNKGLQQKYFLSDAQKSRKTDVTWWDDAGLTSSATRALQTLMDDKSFDTPKPISLIQRMLELTCFFDPQAIVLDFFAGSSTTAHSIMQFNVEDEGQRKFIMVQIPEPTPEGSEARKAGYATIAEIGKERIRRAAKKIREVHPDTKADLGFKVLKLDSSNIKKWQPDYDNLEKDLLGAVNNIVDGRSSEDLLYEVLIKYGLPLTLPVENLHIAGHTVYNVAGGSLVACFDEGITLDTVQAIIGLATLDMPILRIVFRDTSFADDIVKTNAIQRFKQAGIEDVLSI